MSYFLIIMGVAGCGKSSLGRALADAWNLPLIEGDDFHSKQNQAKMSRGIALTDADRQGWLESLNLQIGAHPQGLVLACSALKRAYRDQLRRASPHLRFVFLEIDRANAKARVAARAGQHFFPVQLVDSQFEILESPVGERDVLRVDALQPLQTLCAQVQTWFALGTSAAQQAETEYLAKNFSND
jgi:gluconokinase